MSLLKFSKNILPSSNIHGLAQHNWKWRTFEYITSCLSDYYRKGIFNKILKISKSVFKKNFHIFIWPIWVIVIDKIISFLFILFLSWNSGISMNLKKQSLLNNALLLSLEINFVLDAVQIYCPGKSIQGAKNFLNKKLCGEKTFHTNLFWKKVGEKLHKLILKFW